MLLTEKYAPKRLDDLVNQEDAKRRIKAFLKNFPKKRGALLHGPPGTGKTSTAFALAQEYKWELIELNASDFRTAQAIEERVGKAVQQRSLFAKGKLILIDELEGLSGWYDKGGIKALQAILTKTPYPVILTTQDADDRKIKDLKKLVERIAYQRIPYTEVYAFLKRVCDAEGIAYEEDALKDLASRSSGDLRAALLDVQSLAHLGITNQSITLLGERERVETIESAIIRILKATNPELIRGVFDYVQGNPDEFILWLDENLPHEYVKPTDLARAYAMLSLADVYQARIKRRQYWRLLAYIYYFITIGIAIAKEDKYPGAPRVERPKRPLLIWMKKQQKEKILSLAAKLAESMHTSLTEFMKHDRFILTPLLAKDKALQSWLEEEGISKDAIIAFTKNLIRQVA